MLFIRQTLRATTRTTVPNAAASAVCARFRFASSTVGGTSTDLRSEKTDPAKVQKPNETRQTNASGQKADQAAKGSTQQNAGGKGDNAGSGQEKH
ncbi:uncharacterized protein PG998_013347 [Apiospora kogelbergensis]|uniref:Uncharacterized protein n=1 Tax=Apiospora kogelbergensis TaxID=1337665 RepID=A0AAW0R1N8_9PEZI